MASQDASAQYSPSNDLFPVQQPNLRSTEAPSVISSQMTDLGLENDDEYRVEGVVPSMRPETAMSGGTFSNDPNRPSSTKSSQPRSWTFSQTSRRGVASTRTFGGWRFNGAFGGPGTAMSNSSRPESNTSSQASRTHVPSLASHAFFRPMSSQRLQAQRGGNRLAARGPSIASIDGSSDFGSTTNRNSRGSNTTAQPGPEVSKQKEIPAQSIATDFMEQEHQHTANASLTGNATNHSIGGSERPLYNYTSKPGAMSMNSKEHQRHGNGVPPPAQKSPRSFRPSFLLPTRSSDQAQQNRFSHERLSSSNSSPRSPNAKISSITPPKPGFNYEYFTGNTIFCWGGRLQNTRDRPINIISGLLILILPRNLHPQAIPENPEDPLTLGPPTTDWVRVKSVMPGTSAMDVPTKYCKTCNIWRPLRCHHCRICDNCIETQDHHCVWINNCVGRRNYRYFFTFVSTGTLLGIFLAFASLGHCLRYKSDEGITFAQSIDKQRVPFTMFLYGLLAAPYPASLWAYHLYLMGRGETTREYLNSHKFLKKDRHRPFSQANFFKNWLVILLRPRPPTYYHFKKKYEAGDRRFGERRGKRTAPLVLEQQGGGGVEMHDVGGTKTAFQGPMSLRESQV
ncbi:MAG: hypothetical protein Q9188_000563 [Gyalolechia gomerana]